MIDYKVGHKRIRAIRDAHGIKKATWTSLSMCPLPPDPEVRIDPKWLCRGRRE